MTSESVMNEEETNKALMDLCKAGVLILGHSPQGPTFKISKRFGKHLKGSALALLKARINSRDPLGDVAILALVNWYKGLEEKEAYRLSNALMGVLVAYQEGRR